MTDEPVYWADQLADETVERFPGRDTYLCAAGISPSGLVHAGNFREIITVDLVAKALELRGEDVRFIYSWDDYDRFRKVPENVPDEWEEYIGMPLSNVPDPEGCHSSYARHFESRLEEELEGLGMDIEFIRQSERFQDCEYAPLIKKAMNSREDLREILDQYRREPLDDDWWPLRVYCRTCGKDFTEVVDYDGNYTVSYYCEECDEEHETDFSEDDSVKPPWRVDWPMRWSYEKVSFEPAGKEHSASGGSRDTANEIVSRVYGDEPPVHQMYEFVTSDGKKISGSDGEDAFTLSDLKEIYTPEMIRFLFAGTRPSKAFEIPFGEEVIQRYESFDSLEEEYYDQESDSDKLRTHDEAVYELAVVDVPDEKPVRIPFKHAAFVAQTVPEDDWSTTAIESLKRTGHLPEDFSEQDLEPVLTRLEKARNWAREHAPEDYRYSINYEVPEDVVEDLGDRQREAVKLLADAVRTGEFDGREPLDELIFDVKDDSGLDTGEFFETMYQVLLSRDQGPRLSRLILSIGREDTAKILEQVR